MIELLLIISMMLGFNGEAVSAADYPLDNYGTSGFSGYTVSAPAQIEEEPAEIVEEPPVQAQAEAYVEERQPIAASRQEARREPVENTPVSQAQINSPAPVAPAPAPSGGILGIAANYVGSPYVLYGSPPATFDCSSYIWWVYKQAGIDIPMSVNGQKGAVTPVSDPQPGDLIFYNDFHHVGIYAGNGMTYEALNPSAGVRYGSPVSSNVWYGRIG